MTFLEGAVQLVQSAALFTVVVMCVCRLNAARPGTRLLLRLAYLALAAGAFSAMVEGKATFSTAVLSLGVALSMFADKRRSLCYDKPIAQAFQ